MSVYVCIYDTYIFNMVLFVLQEDITHDAVIVLVGKNCDMEQHRKVSTVEAQQVSNIWSYLLHDTCSDLQFAKLHKMAYIETSGEIGQNFKEVSFVHSQFTVF